MRTKLKREYECEVFEKEQFKQFVLRLMEFSDMPQSELTIGLHSEDGDYEISREVSMDELDDICDFGTFDTLAIYYDNHNILFGLSDNLKELSITYMVFKDVEYTKKLVYFIEYTLELKRMND